MSILSLAIFAALVVGIVSGSSNEPLCKTGDTFRMRNKASNDYVIYKKKSQAHQPRMGQHLLDGESNVFCVHRIDQEREYEDVRIFAIYSGIYTDASETFFNGGVISHSGVENEAGYIRHYRGTDDERFWMHTIGNEITLDPRLNTWQRLAVRDDKFIAIDRVGNQEENNDLMVFTLESID